MTLDPAAFQSHAERLLRAVRDGLVHKTYAEQLSVAENKSHLTLKAKSMLVARVAVKKSCATVEYKKKYDRLFADCGVEAFPTKEGMSKLTVDSFEDVLRLLSAPLAAAAVETLNDGVGQSFACCSRYEACSDALQCVQPDKELAVGCSYRRNLEKGRVFFGKNKTI